MLQLLKVGLHWCSLPFPSPFSCTGIGMVPQQLSTPAARPALLLGERAWVLLQGTSPSQENPGSTASSAKLHIVACQSNAHLCPAFPPCLFALFNLQAPTYQTQKKALAIAQEQQRGSQVLPALEIIIISSTGLIFFPPMWHYGADDSSSA